MAANRSYCRETWKSILLIAWIVSLFVFGLFLFTKGFLLTRIELAAHAYSTPWQRSLGLDERYFVNKSFNRNELNITREKDNVKIHEYVPWITFKKAIVLIVDGLRHDFISKTEPQMEGNFYQNNMLYVQSLVENEKGRSQLFKFIADPPTTTMQRLKALTTGSLPTFIDAGANFASSAILEDNLLYQLKANNKSIVFMGDDTWLDLYPKYFKRMFPFPSFDVKDLDTVDNGVVHHLVPELKRNDWDVVIAHFLGVDHCGHRYGPNHPEMKRKLLQMDSVIKDVVENLDNNTLLYVFGDHGMTQYGDHGGDSENETTAALFVYSKRNIFPPMQESHQLTSVVAQVSIVPTLALQMNIPIPFSNVGIIIEDFFAVGTNDVMFTNGNGIARIDEIRANLNILIALYQNSQQVYDYLMQYSNASSDIPGTTLEKLQMNYLASKEKFASLLNNLLSKRSEYDRKGQLGHILESQSEFRSFVQTVYSTCLDVWAKFDLGLMVIGQLIMAFSSLLPYVLQMRISSSEMYGVDYETNTFLNTVSWREIVGFILNLISWMIVITCHPLTFGIAIICTCFQVSSLLCLMSWKISLNFAAKWLDLKSFSIIDFLVLVAIAVYASFLFSNSFMIMEGSVLLFLIQTLLITWLLWKLNRYLVPKTAQRNEFKEKKSKEDTKYRAVDQVIVLITCICLRVSIFFWNCREEQSSCEVTFLLRPLDAVLYHDSNVKLRQLLSFGSIFIVVLSFYYWCRKHGNLIGLSVTTLSAKIIAPACGLMIALHWMLQLPAKNKLIDIIDVQWVQQALLPRCVYALVVLSLAILFWNPVSAHIVLKHSNSELGEKTTGNELNQNIRVLFNDIRNRINNDYEKSGQNQTEESQTVYAFGLHRVYSTAYFAMMAPLLLVVILLLGDGLAFSVILMILVVVCLLFTARSNAEQSKETSQLTILLMSFLSSYWFFATGHHATIPSIRFDAGFIGFQGDSSSYILQAFLISFNTFSSHVVIALVLPLLHILNTTSMLETDTGITSKNDFKGELLLQKHSLRSNGILIKSLLSYLALRMLHVTIMACVAIVHRRHLMVWKIFGPRFIFEAASFLFSTPFLLFGCLFYFRIDATVGRWMLQLEDLCDTLE